MEINKIYNCDCIDGLKQLPDNSVDLTVTSPPYDNLRSYGNTLEWSFEIFKPIAKELYRVTKPGGVLVWIVGDATIKGGETGSSFKQALYFKEECGFTLHDTMIYEKNGSSRPAQKNSKRYSQIFEYMFVFTKGEIRKDITLIADKRNKWAGWAKWGKNSCYDVDGNLVEVKKNQPVIAEFSLRNNIWKYSVSFNDKTGHPAVFPEKLAEDNIISWTNEGDLVLDPFMGSGTTAKMALLNKRNYIGFEKNTEYYEKSLERVAKYEGKVNESLSGVTCDFGEEQETLQYSTSEDSELAGKTALWNKYIEELNNYFNEQTLSTLKTLKFNFVTKTNEERVKKITGQDTLINNDTSSESVNYNEVCKPVEYTISNITIGADEADCIKSDNGKNGILFSKEFVENILKDERLEEFIVKTVERYFQMKRLPKALIEVNDRAREENEKKNQIQFVTNSQDFIVEKPKRKRRTKSEIEEARKKEEETTQVIATDYAQATVVEEPNVIVTGQAEKEREELGITKEIQEDIKENVKTLFENNTPEDDELPFVFESEEERQRIIGNPLGDIVNGKPVYMHTDEPVIKVKRPRGRPRKTPIN